MRMSPWGRAEEPVMGKSQELEIGGQRGIRTPDTLVTYTRFPGVRLQPLGHLSGILHHDTYLPQTANKQAL